MEKKKGVVTMEWLIGPVLIGLGVCVLAYAVKVFREGR
jgi:hypothetical protein